MSDMGQSTKSLRSSPLRGSKSREAGGRSRGQRWRGGKVNTISSCIVGVQPMIKSSKDDLRAGPPDAASHIDAITKVVLTNSANQDCLNVDRSIAQWLWDVLFLPRATS
jgi:hypothetical protein